MRTDFQNMLVEQDESVVTLTMNRPDVLNAINTLMLEELTEAVEAAAHNDAIRCVVLAGAGQDRKSTRLNSSHDQISYAVFCLKKKKKNTIRCRDKQIAPACTSKDGSSHTIQPMHRQTLHRS